MNFLTRKSIHKDTSPSPPAAQGRSGGGGQRSSTKPQRQSMAGRSTSKDQHQRPLDDSDIDNIYTFVKHMKKNKLSESMLEDFVIQQTEQYLDETDHGSGGRRRESSSRSSPPKQIQIVRRSPKAA